MATMPMSFAKVAASNGKENVALTKVAARKTVVTGLAGRDIPPDAAKKVFSHSEGTSKAFPSSRSPAEAQRPRDESTGGAATQDSIASSKLVQAVAEIDLNRPTPSLVVNGTSAADDSTGLFGDGSPDDPYQRGDSSSDLGTKPPSLDGKSITSGTTFALDEKESLRPDDSASVKAVDDDDAFSGRGSIVAGSRIGSEVAARAYRAQMYENSDRRAMATTRENNVQGVITPLSGSSGQQILDGVNIQPNAGTATTPEGFSLFYKQTPDEKLLEALESPKNRIFLLRLEQDLIEFVKDSKEPFIDLPPCNSFCRLLTHKLADYYHMTHQFDNVEGSVRIFRTPFCRLPQSLTAISNPPTTGNTPPPTIPAMKIMRRGGADTGDSPSKATSETESDNKDKASAKEILSREEREAKYYSVRDRIFGTEKTGDITPETEDGNDMSRSSSISAKERSGQGKRAKSGKTRRDDSDTFDVRSQYTPFFPAQAQPQPAWTQMPQFGSMGVPQYGNPMQNSYPGTPSQQYSLPPQQFHPAMMVNPGMPPYGQMPVSQQFQRPSPQQFQPAMNQMPPMAPMPIYNSPVQNQQQQMRPQWTQGPYQNPYQSRGPVPGGSTIPYLYGQLPSTANPADPKSQHPIPGSFNRHAFNPKTQSFIPGNLGVSPQQQQQQMPLHASPHLQYNAFNTPPPYGNGMGYNMSRQGSNTSLPSFHASPHMPPRPMMHPGMNPVVANGNHIPHYGNLSTLPPKPPPAV